MLKCNKCGVEKELSEFTWRTDRQQYRRVCKACKSEGQRQRYKKHKEKAYFKHKATRARSRASGLGVPYNLTEEYLESIWTDVCPVLGILFNRHADRKDESAPELDRLIPDKGYVIGNVVFMSRKANRLKNNASYRDLKELLGWMEQIGLAS